MRSTPSALVEMASKRSSLLRRGLEWWTQSSTSALLSSQERIFQRLLPHPFRVLPPVAGVNAVQFDAPSRTIGSSGDDDDKRPTCVVAHGFGSGLGFFYSNVAALVDSGQFRRVLLVDWLGMGGSERPSCWNRPYRSMFSGCSSWCDAHFSTPDQAVGFFIDPMEQFLEDQDMPSRSMVLVGHSLGGYLAGKYALKFPQRLQKLILASPVGIPNKPDDFDKASVPQPRLPMSLRLIDSLWSANMTPQALVRLQGGTRGHRNVRRVLHGRIPGLSNEAADMLADYLYHITVAPPSGEFAMNSLLEPVLTSNAAGVYAREPLEDALLTSLDPKIALRVSFGDTDWMRSEANETSARRVVQQRNKNGRDNNDRVDIIPSAGHHLYMENPIAFANTILT